MLAVIKDKETVINIPFVTHRAKLWGTVLQPLLLMLAEKDICKGEAERQAHPDTVYLFIELFIEQEVGV